MKQIALSLFAFFFCLATIKAQSYNATVAKDGTGDYTTVQAAINAAPASRTTAWVIYIKNGKYREKITVASTKTFIQLVGESVANTILYYDDPATILGTQNSASVTISANDFSAMNITFANTFGDGSQAVAIVVNADRAAFKNCRFLGNQDTVYLKGSGTPRCYFKNCYIDGNVDFIFGSAVAYFDSCVVYAKTRTSAGTSYITAPNTPSGQTYGYVFRDTKLPMNAGSTLYYLSRPWPSPDVATTRQKAVFLNSQMSGHIHSAGWSIWDANTVTANLTNAEYNSRNFNGTAVDISQRAAWSTQLTQSDSATFSLSNVLTNWDPCGVASGFCTGNARSIAVSNFRGVKGSTTAKFDWNISWGMTGIQYDLYRSSDKVNFSIVNTQTATSDTAVNFTYTDANPAANSSYYYYVKASLSGLATHYTDTVVISSIPTIATSGSLSSFSQSVGSASNSQSLLVSGTSLTNDVVITAPANYEISSNGGTTWVTSSSSISLTPAAGTLASTTIAVRLNTSAIGSYSGNLSLTSTNATPITIALTGTTQVATLVSNTIQHWPMTANANDSAGVRDAGVVASTPTFNKLYVSNGTTLATVPAYSTLHGQAYGASSNGDGSWGTATPTFGPGGNLNRTFYEQFTITASSLYSLRVDSLILTSSFYNTSSNTKLAVVYSKTGFASDSADVTGGLDPTGLGLSSGANGAFATPILLLNETTGGNTKNYRLALNGSNGVSLNAGQTLTIRLYNSCGSTSNGRYAKIKNVIAKGQSTLNPVVGDYRSHQTGDWATTSTWERWDGTTWVTPAPTYPVYNNSNVTNILSGHTVTVSSTLANGSGYIHLTKVNTGGQLIVNSGVTLNLANGATPTTTQLQVDGNLTQSGTIGTNGYVAVVVNGTYVASGTLNLSNTGDSLIINSGGTYQHNVNSGTTPTRIRGAVGSTFSVTGITSNQTNIFKSACTYGNIVWNCASQANYYAFRNNLTTTNVLGSFTVVSTGTSYISFNNASGNATFPSGYYQTGGTVNYRESGTVTDSLFVGGDFNVSGGTFNPNMGTGNSLTVMLSGSNKTLNYSATNALNTNWTLSGNYTLGSSLTVNGQLSLVSGVLTTGSNIAIVSSTGSLVRTSGWVNGNLRKRVSSGTNSAQTFEVGDATNYLPVSTTFASVTTAGDVTAFIGSSASAEPNYASFPLSKIAYLNRYWSLTSANTLVFTNYAATFNFLSGDFLGGASASSVKAGLYNSGWSTNSTTTTAATNNTVSGLTALGNFSFANCASLLTPSVAIASNTGGVVCTGGSITFTATPTNGGSSPLYQWKQNGNNVGSGGTTLTLQQNQVSNGDVISCVLTANNTCQTTATATSGDITLTVGSVTPSITISTASTSVCSGSNIAFTAVAVNGGSSPNYQWKKNGVNAGSGGSSITFPSNSLSNGDVITCLLTANNVCQTSATATSNAIAMTVKASPAVAQITNGVSTVTAASLCTLGKTTPYYNVTPYGTWSSSNPTVASVTGGSQAGNVTANVAGTATISYNVAATNGCVSSSTIAITVAPVTANAITGNNSICVNATTALSSTAPVGTTGVWSSSNDRGTVNASGVYTGTNAGTYGEARYTVTNTITGCTAFSSKTITVNPTPVTPTITYAAGTVGNPQAGAPTGSFCVGKVFTVAATPNVPLGVWSATGAASITSGGVVTINAVGAGSVKYTYTSAAGCVSSRTMSGNGYTCAARGAIGNEPISN